MSSQYALSRASIAVPFFNTIKEYGKDPRIITKQLGIDDHVFTNSNLYLPSYSLGHLLDCSAKLTNCDDIGFISGHIGTTQDLHPKLVSLLANQETLMDALLALSQWLHLQGSHFNLEFEYIEGELRIYHTSSLHSSHRGFKHAHLFTTSRLIKLLSKYQGTDWKPNYIVLQPDIADTTQIAQKTENGRVLVGQPKSYIAINCQIESMGATNSTYRDKSTNALQQLKIIINTLWCTNNFSLELIAHLFGISERTVQRIFTESGDTFRNYINNLKVDQAKQLLLQGFSVTQTAEKLQYTEPANLSRAIKKQTGLSPMQYINQHARDYTPELQ
ncbi:helix-turn-helix transcriptional regulator [Psychromonas sp. MME2]|uniref:helix-turn-helix domain-containing protein n=1 Tax=unclassified Psychromonas TaxID=2614957 RepID=UPI00339C654C